MSRRRSRRRAADLPAALKSNPTYNKFNPADAPILILAMTSEYADARRNCMIPRIPCWSSSFRKSPGWGMWSWAARALPAVRVESAAGAFVQLRHRAGGCARGAGGGQCQFAEGIFRSAATQRLQTLYQRPVGPSPPHYRNLLIAYRNGQAVRLDDVADVDGLGRERAERRPVQRQAGGAGDRASKSPTANVIQTVDRGEGDCCRNCARHLPPSIRCGGGAGPFSQSIRAALARYRAARCSSAILLVVAVVFVFLRSPRGHADPWAGRADFHSRRVRADVSAGVQRWIICR